MTETEKFFLEMIKQQSAEIEFLKSKYETLDREYQRLWKIYAEKDEKFFRKIKEKKTHETN